jgi:helix-turn-helix protein
MSKPLKTTPEAAARLRCAPNTLEKMRVEGRGPKYTLVGKLVRYSDEHLDQYIATRTRQSTSEPSRKR